MIRGSAAEVGWDHVCSGRKEAEEETLCCRPAMRATSAQGQQSKLSRCRHFENEILPDENETVEEEKSSMLHKETMFRLASSPCFFLYSLFFDHFRSFQRCGLFPRSCHTSFSSATGVLHLGHRQWLHDILNAGLGNLKNKEDVATECDSFWWVGQLVFTQNTLNTKACCSAEVKVLVIRNTSSQETWTHKTKTPLCLNRGRFTK